MSELDAAPVEHAPAVEGPTRGPGGATTSTVSGAAAGATRTATATARDAAGSLALDRLAAGPPVLQRSARQLLDGTVQAFDAFAGDQVDWPTRISPSTPQGAQLWALLELLRREPALLAACGLMRVRDLIAAQVPGAGTQAMLRFATSVARSYDTVELSPTETAAKALRYGRALQALETTIPGLALKRCFRGRALDSLLELGLVDAFCAYVRATNPILSADDGSEIMSFIALHAETGSKPAKYLGRISHVRNFHHFKAGALEVMARNEADRSKRRPLTLVLHSSQDHNGAYHRDPELEVLVSDRRNLVIVVEGAGSLAELQALVPALAQEYGQRGKIDQVMLAGHGNARSMQMAASMDSAGAMVTESLNLDKNAANTNALLRTLLAHMDEDGPHRRILLNACLTASNSLPNRLALSSDPAVARTQITEAMRQHESFAAHLQRLIGAQPIQVLGANASIGVVGLLDPATAALDLRSGEDPLVTAPKLDYVRAGIEPTGVIRAALECWNKNPTAALPVVRARASIVPGQWDTRVIKAHLDLLLAHWDRPAQAATLDGSIEAWAELPSEGVVTAWGLVSSAPASIRSAVARSMETDALWRGGIPHVGLVGLQGLLDTAEGGNRAVQLTAHAGAHYTAQSAARFVDDRDLAPYYGALCVRPTTPPPGALVLALLGASRGSAPALAYLRLVRGGQPRFAARLELSRHIGGLFSERDLYDWLDPRSATGPASTEPLPEIAPTENLDVDGDGRNDLHVEPRAERRRLGFAASAFTRPARGGVLRASLASGTIVRVVGETAGDWVLALPEGTAFITADDRHTLHHSGG